MQSHHECYEHEILYAGFDCEPFKIEFEKILKKIRFDRVMGLEYFPIFSLLNFGPKILTPPFNLEL